MEGFQTNTQETGPKEERGTISKLRELMDSYAVTKKALPIIAIIGILGSVEARADTDNDAGPDLQTQFETLTDNHEAGPEIKKAIEDFENSAVPSGLDAEDKILYSKSIVYSYDANGNDTMYPGVAGEMPHVGTNITIDGGVLTASFEDVSNENSGIWNGLKSRINIAVESDTIVPEGDKFEVEGNGFSPDEAIIDALKNKNPANTQTIETETTTSSEAMEENVLSELYTKTSSLFESHIANYQVVDVEAVENEDGTISYSATLSIQPGVIETSE